MKRIFVADQYSEEHGWQLAELKQVPVHLAEDEIKFLQAKFPHLHFELGLALVGQYPIENNVVC